MAGSQIYFHCRNFENIHTNAIKKRYQTSWKNSQKIYKLLIKFNRDHEKRQMLLCIHLLLQLRFGIAIFTTLPLSNIANIMEITAITEAVVNIISNAISEGKDRITPLIFRID